MKSVVLVLLLLPAFTMAAVAPNKSSKQIHSGSSEEKFEKIDISEILSLPLANAKNLVRDQQNAAMYSSLLATANNESEAMALRWKAVQLLSQFSDSKAIHDLKKLGQSDTWFVKNSALLALHSLDPKKANDLAYELLDDKALVVRSAAVDILNQTGKIKRDILWTELNKQYNFRKGQSLWVRAQIVELLAKDPQGIELPLFAELLNEKETRIQQAAVQSLEKIRGVSLGKNQDSFNKKRDLWVAWWKKNSAE